MRIEVEFGWDVPLLERLKVEESVLLVEGIVFGLKKKGWRCVGAGVDASRQIIKSRAVGKIGGVEDDDEVGTCVDLIENIAGALVIGVIAEDDDKMSACREAQCADAFGIYAPLCGVRTGEAHGLLSVLEVCGIFRIVICKGDTILDQHTGDADGVEPGADLDALKIVGEDAVGSAGEDDDGSSGVVVCGRGVEGEVGSADVGEVSERASVDQAVGGLGDVGLGGAGVGLWRAAGPEGNGGLLGVSYRGEEGEDKDKMEAHGNNGNALQLCSATERRFALFRRSQPRPRVPFGGDRGDRHRAV